jgi:hypothetical protein
MEVHMWERRDMLHASGSKAGEVSFFAAAMRTYQHVDLLASPPVSVHEGGEVNPAGDVLYRYKGISHGWQGISEAKINMLALQKALRKYPERKPGQLPTKSKSQLFGVFPSERDEHVLFCNGVPFSEREVGDCTKKFHKKSKKGNGKGEGEEDGE